MTLFYNIFDQAPYALFITQHVNHIHYSNSKALEQFNGIIPSCYHHHITQCYDYKERLHDYTQHDYDASFIPIYDDDIIYIMVAIVSKNRVVSHHDTQALEILTRGFAHEMKNPLFAIRGAAQLLQNKSNNNPLCSIIIQEIDRLDGLINSMSALQYADDVTSLKACNIHEIIQPLLNAASVSYGKHVIFDERYDPSIPPILADTERLSQALVNIIKNACEAANKHIIIRTNYMMNAPLINNTEFDTQHALAVRISIEDDGRGFNDEELRMADTLFYSNKSGGHGLGLALAKKILQSHKGQLKISNTSLGHAIVMCDILVAK